MGHNIWDDYNSRQRFEHELLDRKTTWGMTGQSILFAAYGVTLGKRTDEPASFRTVIAYAGVAIAVSGLIGAAFLIRSKYKSWEQYRDFFSDRENPLPGPFEDKELPWGFSRVNTFFTLFPDIALPVVFALAWTALILGWG
jgi:hypothetical protein